MVLDGALSADLNVKDFIPKVFFDTAVYKRDASNLHFRSRQTSSIRRRSRLAALTFLDCRCRPTR